MSLADDLLDQANHLAGRDAARPKQVNLRRAVSASYYALFHLLCSEGAKMAVPARPPNLRPQFQRTFVHADMKSACAAISRAQNAVFVDLVGSPSPNLIRVARAFVALQDERHKADYDVVAKFSRTDVRLSLRDCQ